MDSFASLFIVKINGIIAVRVLLTLFINSDYHCSIIKYLNIYCLNTYPVFLTCRHMFLNS